MEQTRKGRGRRGPNIYYALGTDIPHLSGSVRPRLWEKPVLNLRTDGLVLQGRVRRMLHSPTQDSTEQRGRGDDSR